MADKNPIKHFLHAIVIGLFYGFLAGSMAFSAESLQSLKDRARNYYWGLGTAQNYAKALELYRQAASRGDSEAKFISGAMYFKGLGGKKDLPMAFQLLSEAALSGKSSPESQQIIGQAFLLGSGIPRNYGKALHWFTLAAENGNKEAQNELGFMYFVGKLVEQDVKKGADLFLQAAYKGLAIAQYNVGIMYYTGNGFDTVDLQKSYAWLNLAASSGHRPSTAARNYLETMLTGKDLAAAQNLADELAQKITP